MAIEVWHESGHFDAGQRAPSDRGSIRPPTVTMQIVSSGR